MIPDADKKHRENKNENIVVLVHLLFSDVGKKEQDRHEKGLGFPHKKMCFFSALYYKGVFKKNLALFCEKKIILAAFF